MITSSYCFTRFILICRYYSDCLQSVFTFVLSASNVSITTHFYYLNLLFLFQFLKLRVHKLDLIVRNNLHLWQLDFFQFTHMFQLISWYILTIFKYKGILNEKKLVIILSIICIIAGGYFTMEYLKQKEKKNNFGNDKKHEWKSIFVIILKMYNLLHLQKIR